MSFPRNSFQFKPAADFEFRRVQKAKFRAELEMCNSRTDKFLLPVPADSFSRKLKEKSRVTWLSGEPKEHSGSRLEGGGALPVWCKCCVLEYRTSMIISISQFYTGADDDGN